MENQLFVKSQLVLITPEMAQDLLKKNTHNRRPRDSHVEKIAAAIMRGEWVVNGDAIRISKSGVLLDGQHRLLGIVKSGVAVFSMITTGLDDDVFHSIDRGAGRTISDALHLKGEVNCSKIASAAKLLYVWEKRGNPYIGTLDVPSAAQVIGILEQNPYLRESAKAVSGSAWFKKNLPQASAVFCHFVFHKHNPEKCALFFEALQSGANLANDSPVFHVREIIMGNRQGGAISETSRTYKTALLFKAFKLFCANKPVKRLSVVLNGKESENRDLFVL